MHMNKRQFLAGSAAFAGATMSWSISARGQSLAQITASHSVNTTIYAAHMVAQNKGFAEEAGLEMHVIEAQGGSNVRKILAAGQVGYALGDSSHPLQLTNRGRPAKILMATDNRCSYANIVVRKELYDQGIDSVEKLADYKRDGGKPIIAATGIGSGTWVYGTYVLEQHGVADRFNWIAGGGSKTMLGGLKTGKFDAIMAVPIWIFTAEDGGYGRTIYDITDEESWNRVFGGPIPATVVYVLEDTVESEPELTGQYVSAILKSMQWLGEASTDEIYATIGPVMPRFDEATVRREIEYYRKIWQYDGAFPQNYFENGAGVWFREQTKIGALDYGEVADMRFLEDAQKG